MAPALGSRTSGVDGSSEGGRISTIRLPQTLVLYAVPLIESLRASGHRGKVDAAPVLVDGIWCLQLSFDGAPPAAVPALWHGHRVIVAAAGG